MHSRSRIGCAVLATGTPPRMGRGTDLAFVAGQPLIQRVTLAACRARVVRTAVIVGSRADEGASAVSNLPVDIISNPRGIDGLASSVHSAVGWARGRHLDGLLLAMVDGRALSTAHLDALVEASDGALHVVGSAYEGVPGLPALFPRDAYSRLEELVGDVDAQAIVLDADPDFPVLMINLPRGAGEERGELSRPTQPRVVSHRMPEGSRGK